MNDSTRVYVFGTKLPKDARAVVEDEIERGRLYYNSMIDALNDRLAGPRDPSNPKERLTGLGDAARIERIVTWFASGRDWSKDTIKSLAAKAIYSRIRKLARDIRANPKFSGEASGCYKGSYDEIGSDFDRATSSKRVGVWPGEPFRVRFPDSHDGAKVGCRFSDAPTWGDIRAGKRTILSSCPDRDWGPPGSKHKRHFVVSLKVAKASPPIEFDAMLPKPCRSSGGHRRIPSDAIVLSAKLARRGDYGTGNKYVLLVTIKIPERKLDLPESTDERVGIDFGFASTKTAGLLVARTSSGNELVLPPYAIRFAVSESAIQAERDALAKAVRSRNPECTAKSAAWTAKWIAKHAADSEADYLKLERDLHRRQDHVRRRYIAIRTDIYKKFARDYGHRCWILKTKLKQQSEGELKDDPKNFDRKLAAIFQLAQILRNNGAVEVVATRDESLMPTSENCERILQAGVNGSLLVRASRKQVRKYRKRKAS